MKKLLALLIALSSFFLFACEDPAEEIFNNQIEKADVGDFDDESGDGDFDDESGDGDFDDESDIGDFDNES